jgi:hypothetical protein
MQQCPGEANNRLLVTKFPEPSLSCLQDLVTGPYPEPDESTKDLKFFRVEYGDDDDDDDLSFGAV